MLDLSAHVRGAGIGKYGHFVHATVTGYRCAVPAPLGVRARDLVLGELDGNLA